MNGRIRGTQLAVLIALCVSLNVAEAQTMEPYFGYSQCLVLKNEHARVVLCPQAGGRVLEYSWKGANSLYLDPQQQGWVYTPGQPTVDPCGGRFDVGPENTIARHPALWFGPWTAEAAGPLAARMTSVDDPATGLRLTRDFTLDAQSSRLTCRQTITNTGAQPVSTCHWSRTLAAGDGICLIPLTPGSRFPNNYLQYGPGPVMNFRPEDPSIRVRDGFLEIFATPERPKLGMDSAAGWFGYLMKNDLLFVKRFAVDPGRVYNEMAGLTISIWYFRDSMCELEPIGPQEKLAPGQSASFTEQWWLLPYKFPQDRQAADLERVKRLVEEQAR